MEYRNADFKSLSASHASAGVGRGGDAGLAGPQRGALPRAGAGSGGAAGAGRGLAGEMYGWA